MKIWLGGDDMHFLLYSDILIEDHLIFRVYFSFKTRTRKRLSITILIRRRSFGCLNEKTRVHETRAITLYLYYATYVYVLHYICIHLVQIIILNMHFKIMTTATHLFK